MKVKKIIGWTFLFAAAVLIALVVSPPFTNLANRATDNLIEHHPGLTNFIHQNIIVLLMACAFIGICLWRWRLAVCVFTIAWLITCPWQTIVAVLYATFIMALIFSSIIRYRKRREIV